MTDEPKESPTKGGRRRGHRKWRPRIRIEIILLAWHTILVAVATWETWPLH